MPNMRMRGPICCPTHLQEEHARVAREDAEPVAEHVAEGGGLVPAVRHALHVGVSVEEGEGVGQPDHVDVREQHVAADGEEVDQDLWNRQS